MTDHTDYFTLVFQGDLTIFASNPHLVDTPFGRPIAAALGHRLYDEIEDGALTPTGEAERYHAIYESVHANTPVDPDTSFDVSGFLDDLEKHGFKVVSI